MKLTKSRDFHAIFKSQHISAVCFILGKFLYMLYNADSTRVYFSYISICVD